MLMNRVQLRNNTWYFRARIPAPLQYLAPVKYFFRSLHTGNRKEALAKSLSHSYILDLEIKLLRKLDMLIKSGKIVLDKDDINKIIKYKLDKLTDALSDNYDDIVDGTFDKDSISVFKGNTSDDEHNEIIARLKDNTPSTPTYICQFCGKKNTTPHGGIYRFSPYKNKTHKFIKAWIEEKRVI